MPASAGWGIELEIAKKLKIINPNNGNFGISALQYIVGSCHKLEMVTGRDCKCDMYHIPDSFTPN